MEPYLLAVVNMSAALLFGGMFAFTGFLAPMAFARLPEEHSVPFVQGIFPAYYIAGSFLSAIGAFAALAAGRQPEAIILWLVALGFLFSRYFLMPRALAARDARERGEPGAASRFTEVHKRAAFLNIMQMTGSAVVLVRLVL
jgi:hypothetical protein